MNNIGITWEFIRNANTWAPLPNLRNSEKESLQERVLRHAPVWEPLIWLRGSEVNKQVDVTSSSSHCGVTSIRFTLPLWSTIRLGKMRTNCFQVLGRQCKAVIFEIVQHIRCGPHCVWGQHGEEEPKQKGAVSLGRTNRDLLGATYICRTWRQRRGRNTEKEPSKYA